MKGACLEEHGHCVLQASQSSSQEGWKGLEGVNGTAGGDGEPQAALPGQDCSARAWRDWLQGWESRMPGAAEASKEGGSTLGGMQAEDVQGAAKEIMLVLWKKGDLSQKLEPGSGRPFLVG